MANNLANGAEQMSPPPRFRRPCLDCGQLAYGNRCETHQTEWNRKHRTPDTPERKAKKRLYYNSDYRKRAKFVRDNAVLCHLCGEGYRPGDPWQADHLQPGNPHSPLAPAHRSCNAKRGNKPLN